MTDATLLTAFDAVYRAAFRWIKAALQITATLGFYGPHHHTAISPQRRAQVYERDGGICYLCRLPVDAACKDGPWACTIDHIRPLSYNGLRHALANLSLAHQQCNQLKAWSPHPRTLFARDTWRCRRCGETISHNETDFDWHWNRPIVEHLVPLNAPDIWQPSRAWACHLRCHAYHLPIPAAPVAPSTVASTVSVGHPDLMPVSFCPPHDWYRDVYPLSGQEYERCTRCHATRPYLPRPRLRCEACQGNGYLQRVSYPAPCSACGGLGFIAGALPDEANDEKVQTFLE